MPAAVSSKMVAAFCSLTAAASHVPSSAFSLSNAAPRRRRRPDARGSITTMANAATASLSRSEWVTGPHSMPPCVSQRERAPAYFIHRRTGLDGIDTPGRSGASWPCSGHDLRGRAFWARIRQLMKYPAGHRATRQAPAPPPDTEIFLAALSVRGGKVRSARQQCLEQPRLRQSAVVHAGRSGDFLHVRPRRRVPDPRTAPRPAATSIDTTLTTAVSAVTDSPESEYIADRHAGPASHLRHSSRSRRNTAAVAVPLRALSSAPSTAKPATARPERHQARRISRVGERHPLAIFVLGQPATLQLADRRPERPEGRDRHRPINPASAGGGISFVQRGLLRPHANRRLDGCERRTRDASRRRGRSSRAPGRGDRGRPAWSAEVRCSWPLQRRTAAGGEAARRRCQPLVDLAARSA